MLNDNNQTFPLISPSNNTKEAVNKNDLLYSHYSSDSIVTIRGKSYNRHIKVKKRHDPLHLTKEKKANLHLLHIESHPPKQALNQYKEVRSQEHEGQGEEQRGSSQQQAQKVRSI